MLFIIIVGIICIFLCYIYYNFVYKEKQIYNSFKSQGIPGEPFIPIIGQLRDIRQYTRADKFMQYHIDLQQKYGNIYTMMFGPVMRLYIHEPDYIGDVLRKYTKFYNKPELFRTVFIPLIGKTNLLVSENDIHDRARKMLNEAFHFINLQSMISIISQQTTNTIDEWLLEISKNSEKEFDIQYKLNTLTLSVITSSAFGQNFYAKNTQEIICNSVTDILDAIQYRSLNMINQIPILSKLPIAKKPLIAQRVKQLTTITDQVINDRRLGKSHSLGSGKDLLDLLLLAKDDDGNGFDDQQIKEHALTFILAGHETTGTLLTWCMYVLMTNASIFHVCREEIDRILQGKAPSYDKLDELHLVDAVIHETLRLYTPAPFITRQCIKEHYIGPENGKQIYIPVGATIILNSYVLHRSPLYWKNPLEFDYKRWMRNVDGLKPKLSHRFCYLPFSAGNRNCIGSNFALLEAKVILSMLIQRLQFEIVPGQNIVPAVTSITMRPKCGLLAKYENYEAIIIPCYVLSGQRLEIPSDVLDLYKQIILKSWPQDPDQRSTCLQFNQLIALSQPPFYLYELNFNFVVLTILANSDDETSTSSLKNPTEFLKMILKNLKAVPVIPPSSFCYSTLELANDFKTIFNELKKNRYLATAHDISNIYFGDNGAQYVAHLLNDIKTLKELVVARSEITAEYKASSEKEHCIGFSFDLSKAF
ncbi:unnamed protein product [Didymodactylos carnosus]|uniref:Cytochrome P450 n=1 Tax=Didymodactylos carnosus TaxID=1234261 RepID=A0A815AMF6_9BILA|nr:unnamed protein product [Didymodactylos carnosus]CAF1259307.1 unnamed protein product [Didymodactylos carnosus]CAF3657402.1 unnamed protein product [Didymodactylos carnosus]CAF4035409.1 unnamed protein product [Didymodactylos carnosus]